MEKLSREGYSLEKVIAGVIGMLLLSVVSPGNVSAMRYKNGPFSVDFNSELSLGGSYRVEGRDWDLVGKCNQPEFNDPGKGFTDPTTLAGDDVFFATRLSGSVPRGAWSSSGDDGNLNFDPGIFSEAVKGTHEFDIMYNNTGIFARATWFYDNYLMRESENMRIDIMENDDIRENHGQSIDMLDYFFYSSFDVKDIPVSIRVGSQRINWGEAYFMGHGLSVANPVDAAKTRVPGADSFKEAFVPLGAVWTSIGLSDTFNFEAYYQYEWQATESDSPGTYFSTSDVAGPGGQVTQFGYAQNPDYLGLDSNWRYAFGDSGLGYGTGYSVVRRLDDRDADDAGQYGLKLDWFAEFINQTEFSLYFANYHSRRPMVNFYGHMGIPAVFVERSHHGIDLRFVYPEDIKLYGLSFNTLLPSGISCGGEVAYRVDEPYAIEGTDMAYKAAEAGGVAPNDNEPISQVPGTYGPGDEIEGFIRLDSLNYDISFMKSVNRFLGAQILLLAEFGVTQILDMPKQDKTDQGWPDYLRLETPGTDRSGIPARAGQSMFIGPTWREPEGLTENDFADDFAWGYVTYLRLQYTDVFWSVNILPSIRFTHDVSGTTPTGAGTFIEGRQQLNLNLAFEYMGRWTWQLGYTMYSGGDGTANLLADRDYVSFDVKYRI